MSENQNSKQSPKWSNNTKLVVALTFVAIIALVLISFRNILGPILLAMVLAYLLYPIVTQIHLKLKIKWRFAATIFYVFLLLILLGLLTWGGFAIFEQAQNLIRFLQNTLNNLPELLAKWSNEVIQIGPFELDLSKFDLTAVSQQLLGIVQPLLTRTGSILGSVASGAASTIGWMIFILLFAYFTTAETEGSPGRLIDIRIPGYSYDLHRMGVELGKIWNGFLRGQLIIMIITIIVYTILLGILGVRYYFGLAILAGLARFLPYIGPAIAWVTYALVCIFQGTTFANLTPVAYAIVVVAVGMVTDWILDNIIVPRLMSNALRVHPAAVMIVVLIAASWLGLIGIVLAAPVLATVKLLINYSSRKLFDQDPWDGIQTIPTNPPLPSWLNRIYDRIKRYDWVKKQKPKN
jgi:predicted PurR-regulated permease PerM